jgi:hypothetical protein
MIPARCETAVALAIEIPLSFANSVDKTTDRNIVPSIWLNVSVSPSVDCRKQLDSTGVRRLDKLHIPGSARLLCPRLPRAAILWSE